MCQPIVNTTIWKIMQPWESHLLIHVTDIVLHVIQQSIIKKHIYTKLENMYKYVSKWKNLYK